MKKYSLYLSQKQRDGERKNKEMEREKTGRKIEKNKGRESESKKFQSKRVVHKFHTLRVCDSVLVSVSHIFSHTLL